MNMTYPLLKLGGNYEPEALALFARFTTPPTESRKRLISALIKKLKRASVWSQLDALYLTAAADAQAGQRNWKQDLFNLATQGTVTFTADRGYAGNGVDGYLTTGFAPSTAGARYAQDSSHLSLWCRNNVQSSTQLPMGSRTSAAQHQNLIAPRLGTDVVAFRMNQDVAGASPPNTTSIGHWCARRSGTAAIAIFQNGTLLLSDTAASTGLSGQNIVLGALNTGGVVGNFATHQIAAASMGGSLTDGQVYELYAAISQYLWQIGA